MWKKNHFASQCRAREKTHNVEFEEDETSEEEFLYCVTLKPEMTGTVNSVSEREIYAQMLINEKPIKFHIDCGTTVNVLPSKYVNIEDIQLTKRVLQMWNKTELTPEGICRVTIRNPRNQKKYSVEFIIVKENLTPLLGTAVIQQMGLIEVHEENFEKIAAAKVANTKSQTAQEIIEEYRRNGYWHVKLDDESSRLTTFDTPYVRYRWKRLPFGVSVASEIIQKRLNQALDRLDGLLTVHDDMVIYGLGETDEEATADHNNKLQQFL